MTETHKDSQPHSALSTARPPCIGERPTEKGDSPIADVSELSTRTTLVSSTESDRLRFSHPPSWYQNQSARILWKSFLAFPHSE